MSKYKKFSHVVFKCDYHIVFVSKYRFRVMTGVVKELREQDIKLLYEWKSYEIEEMNVHGLL